MENRYYVALGEFLSHVTVPVVEVPSMNRSSISIFLTRMFLKEFCLQFLEYSYNRLMRTIKVSLLLFTSYFAVCVNSMGCWGDALVARQEGEWVNVTDVNECKPILFI